LKRGESQHFVFVGGYLFARGEEEKAECQKDLTEWNGGVVKDWYIWCFFVDREVHVWKQKSISLLSPVLSRQII
jgi:hypothetical protein